jgi:hypothetical protein
MTVDVGFVLPSSNHHYLLPNSLPTMDNRLHGPLPSSEGCGPVLPCSMEGSGREEHQGGPSQWEAQAVRRETRHERRSCLLPHTAADCFGTPSIPQHPHANHCHPPIDETKTPTPLAHDDASCRITMTTRPSGGRDGPHANLSNATKAQTNQRPPAK